MLSNDDTNWLTNNELSSFVIIYMLSIIVQTKVTLFWPTATTYFFQCHYSHVDYLKISPYSAVDSLYIWFLLYVSADMILWTFTQLLVCLIFDNLLVVPLLHSFIHTVCCILYFHLFCFWLMYIHLVTNLNITTFSYIYPMSENVACLIICKFKKLEEMFICWRCFWLLNACIIFHVTSVVILDYLGIH